MDKFGEFPNIEGWYWLRYYRNNDENPTMYPVHVYMNKGEWEVFNGEYTNTLSELEGCEFCKIDDPK